MSTPGARSEISRHYPIKFPRDGVWWGFHSSNADSHQVAYPGILVSRKDGSSDLNIFGFSIIGNNDSTDANERGLGIVQDTIQKNAYSTDMTQQYGFVASAGWVTNAQVTGTVAVQDFLILTQTWPGVMKAYTTVGLASIHGVAAQTHSGNTSGIKAFFGARI